MSKKKITLTIMSIVIAILIMIIPSITKASTTLTTPLYFGINEFILNSKDARFTSAIVLFSKTNS